MEGVESLRFQHEPVERLSLRFQRFYFFPNIVHLIFHNANICFINIINFFFHLIKLLLTQGFAHQSA